MGNREWVIGNWELGEAKRRDGALGIGRSEAEGLGIGSSPIGRVEFPESSFHF
ncbi:hypothetical protein QUB68_26355 [Microcoleus sp. A006_D1]|uniref:hypothetical protein n=1 Tax=Microcoleus sp. A006_D1 TaxID=3055267 RepID=UPI002FD6663A